MPLVLDTRRRLSCHLNSHLSLSETFIRFYLCSASMFAVHHEYWWCIHMLHHDSSYCIMNTHHECSTHHDAPKTLMKRIISKNDASRRPPCMYLIDPSIFCLLGCLHAPRLFGLVVFWLVYECVLWTESSNFVAFHWICWGVVWMLLAFVGWSMASIG